MTKKEKAMDRFARDLCWAGFSNPKNAGCSKGEYWKKVNPNARADYLRDARVLLWAVRRLGMERVQRALEEIAP